MSFAYQHDLPVFSIQSMWRRTRVYFLALAFTAAGFFFLAGWVAASEEVDGAFHWLSSLPATIAVMSGAVALALERRGHRASEKRHPKKR